MDVNNYDWVWLHELVWAHGQRERKAVLKAAARFKAILVERKTQANDPGGEDVKR